MRSLLYISGPSCSGKSTLAKKILAAFPEYTYLAGDRHWLNHDEHDFNHRVQHTNKDILYELGQSDLSHILLEWVPAYGQFVEDILSICRDNDRCFFQIILNATNTVLSHRKMRRDGIADTGDEGAAAGCIEPQSPVVVESTVTIDTTNLDPSHLLNMVVERTANKSLERTLLFRATQL